jgi:hypothetical protein
LTRSDGGHIIYRRTVVLMEPDESGETQQVQTVSMSATPSDRRAWHNQLADLRRRDNGVLHIFSVEGANVGAAQPHLSVEMRVEMSRLTDLYVKKREAEAELEHITTGIAIIQTGLEDWGVQTPTPGVFIAAQVHAR